MPAEPQIISNSNVERLLIQQLRDNLPYWLGVVERATGRTEPLPPIRTWGVPTGWFMKRSTDDLPYVSFTTPGMVQPPVFDGEGFYSVTQRMEATVVVAARDFDASDRFAKDYAAAIVGCVLNQLPGDPVEAVEWVADEYPVVGADQDAVMIAATNVFTVEVSGVMQRRMPYTGPPLDAGDRPELPALHTVETTEITLDP